MAAPSLFVGLSPSGVGESSHRRLPLNAEMLCGELDTTRDALQASKNLASQVQGELAIAKEPAQHMIKLVVVLSV